MAALIQGRWGGLPVPAVIGSSSHGRGGEQNLLSFCQEPLCAPQGSPLSELNKMLQNPGALMFRPDDYMPEPSLWSLRDQ